MCRINKLEKILLQVLKILHKIDIKLFKCNTPLLQMCYKCVTSKKNVTLDVTECNIQVLHLFICYCVYYSICNTVTLKKEVAEFAGNTSHNKLRKFYSDVREHSGIYTRYIDYNEYLCKQVGIKKSLQGKEP